MKGKLGIFYKQKDGVERIDFFGIFIDIMKCFIAACGLTIICLFFQVGVISPDTRMIYLFYKYVVLIFFTLLCSTTAYSVTSRKWIYEDPPKKEWNIDSSVNPTISTHEAGHAVMAYLLRHEVYNIYLYYGYTDILTAQNFKDAAKIRKEILIHYAGAAAEKIFFGEIFTGCMSNIGTISSDFTAATELLKKHIVMTDDTVSKSMLDAELAEKVIAYSKQFYAEAETILSENKDMVELLRNKLEEKRIMRTQEVNDLFLEHGMSERKIKIEL